MIDRFPAAFPGVSSNLLGDFEQHDIDTDSFRAGLRFTPSDTVEINLTANYSKMDRSGPTYLSIGPGGIPFTADSALIPDYGDDIHENLVEHPGRSTSDIWGITARVDWDVTDTITFTSLSSFREVEADQIWFFSNPNLTALRLSTNAVPLYLEGGNNYSDESDTFTHEFRLTGGNERVFWVGGVYYLKEETVRNETVPAGLSFSDGMGGIGLSLPVIDAGDLQDNETDSYAVFGQLTYNLTDRLAVTIGGRQTWDEKDISRLGTPNALAPGRNFNFTTDDDWSAFTGKVWAGMAGHRRRVPLHHRFRRLQIRRFSRPGSQRARGHYPVRP